MRTAVVATLMLWAAATSHRIVVLTQSSEVSRAAQSAIVISTGEIKWVQVRPGQETTTRATFARWSSPVR